MQCPNCGTAAESGAAFCGACGAQLPAEAAPTEPLPQAPVPPPLPKAPEPEPAPAPEPPPAPEVEPPPMPAGAVPAYQPPYAEQPAYVPPQAPVKKKRTGCIIAVVVVVLLGCIGAVIAGALLFLPVKQVITEIPAPVEATTDVAPVAEGFTTPEAALESVLETDWVYKATRTTADRVSYWTGPPNSEYVYEVIVEKGADGSWTVTDQYTIGGGDVPSGDVGSAAEEEARSVLAQFLDYIQADKPDEAHKLTVEPFSLDGASAAYSNGEFLSYEMLEATAQDDGTYWIHVREVWKSSTEDWGYYLVPTEAGYRISSLEPW